MTVYADTSFVVSLSVNQIYSDEARAVIAKHGGTIAISELVHFEFINAIQLMVYREKISVAESKSVLRNFHADIEDGLMDERKADAAVWAAAARIAERHTAQLGTRSLDILHVAMALDIGAQTFWSFDQRQNELARAEGFATLR